MDTNTFRWDQPGGKALARWFKDLEDDRGGRAHLRRARAPAEVLFEPALYRFVGKLRAAGETVRDSDLERLAGIAGLAAHLRENVWQASAGDEAALRRRSFARQLAGDGRSGRAALSPLRFRRLLAIEDRQKLYRHLVRCLRLLDGRGNLLDLAASYYFWGPKVRQRWAYDYYDNLPSSEPPETQN